MKKIIIDPHYCSREEYAELLFYLKENNWDFHIQESDSSVSGEKEPAGTSP